MPHQQNSKKNQQKTEQKNKINPLEDFWQNFSSDSPNSANQLLKQDIGHNYISKSNKAYSLLDSGYGYKLEQIGQLRLIRPEAQALWRPRASKQLWQSFDAFFTGDIEQEAMGRWEFSRNFARRAKLNLRPANQPRAQEHGAKGQAALTASGKLPIDSWRVSLNLNKTDQIAFLARFTSFRHIGFFPEQLPHWQKLIELITRFQQKYNRPLRLLNLFGYTGIASLIAAKYGAHVTHIDASKKAIAWAKTNQIIADLTDKPVRWICEDAGKFTEREIRRGQKYDIILLDPPAYGRGPKGEVWQLFPHLSSLLKSCRLLLSEQACGLFLTAYAIRASFLMLHNLMNEILADINMPNSLLRSGELLLCEKDSPRLIGTAIYSYWINNLN